MSNLRPVRAAVIYSQVGPASPIGAYSSNDSGNATDQKIADNFVVNTPGPTSVRLLRFIGGYGVRNPPPSTPPLNALPPDNFRVVFFADSAGAPGLPLVGGDFHVGAPVQRTPTGGPMLNGIVMPLEYFVDLGAGITMSPSTVYWMSIVNNPGANYSWAWANTAGAYDQRVAGTLGDILVGPWNVSSGGGMYFELSDSNIPEPTSFGVFLAGVFGIWCIRLTARPKR
jgi:hypothetical protein